MEEMTYYTVWQSCNFKISCSLEAYILPNPPHEYSNSLHKMFSEFVWNKNRTRLIEKQFIKACLPHLKTFISALKLAWIRKFIDTNDKLKTIALVKYPFIKNTERCEPRVVNAYS